VILIFIINIYRVKHVSQYYFASKRYLSSHNNDIHVKHAQKRTYPVKLKENEEGIPWNRYMHPLFIEAHSC